MATETQHRLEVEGVGPVEVGVADDGTGHPFLLLHGGAGPQSVAAFGALLVTRRQARAIIADPPGLRGHAAARRP